MLHSFLYAPFSDPARQAQFDAVQTALEDAAEPGTAVLLGNLTIGTTRLDALLVRAHSLTVVELVPDGGQLTVHPVSGAWQLNGQSGPATAALDQALSLFSRRQAAVAAWLSTQLGARVAPAGVTGLALFAATTTFGPMVAAHLHSRLGTQPFLLLDSAPALPAQLSRLAHPELTLPEAALQAWVRELAGDDEAEETENTAPAGFWEQKAWQLWRWLGAEDIPHDAPYGGYPPAPDAVAISQQEKARLEQIRQQVRAELSEQSQAAATREAEREQTIAELQARLAQAPAVAAEAAALQARLAAEAREKAALAEAVRAARAEAAAQNQRLDARIEQLTQQIRQLQTAPAPGGGQSAGPVPPPPLRPPVSRTAPRRPAPRAQWHLQWSRVAIVAAVLGWSGAAVWGISHLTRQFWPAPFPTRSAKVAPRANSSAAQEDAEAGADELAADSAVDEASIPAADAGQDSVEPAPRPAPEVRDSSQVLAPVQEPDHDEAGR
jgi:hypothetical protein